MNIYLDSLDELLQGFKKEAGFSLRLSENPENWPQEITSDLYKQLPFLADYEVRVTLDKLDKQRAYAFGYADLSNKTERPEVEHEESGIPHLRIPLVAIERKVKPYLILLDGDRVLPLTEDRVRELLFNPQTFDLSTSKPADPSLHDQFQPPTRSGYGETKTAGANLVANVAAAAAPAKRLKGVGSALALGAAGAGGFLAGHSGKKPSAEPEKTASMLKKIAHTVREQDLVSFMERVGSDATLQAGFHRSGAGPLIVEAFSNVKWASVEDRLEVLADGILPSVVSLQKLPGGDFLVKSAATKAFKGDKKAKGEKVTQEAAAEAIGPEMAQGMQPGQVATAVADPVQLGAEEPADIRVIDTFGEFLVQDAMGNSVLGWVFPQTLAWDGNFTPQPMALFTNGSVYALQDQVAGELVGKGTTLPKSSPLGTGCLYTTDGGRAMCTQPITVGSSAAGPDGSPTFMGTDVFGQQVQVSFQPGLKSPTRISDIEYAFPDTWKFMRLNQQTQLMSDPQGGEKLASARNLHSTATLWFNGSFNIEGECGLSKIASEFRYDLDRMGAEFILGVLGVDGVTAKQKVAEARKKGSVKLAGLKTIETLSERYSESVKTASALLKEIPHLRRDLVKEAAALEDEGTVDHILSLNFINPENLATFVASVPELEVTSEKLAEMLLFSYLGIKEIPEGAVERCMKSLEEVIVALKAVAGAE